MRIGIYYPKTLLSERDYLELASGDGWNGALVVGSTAAVGRMPPSPRIRFAAQALAQWGGQAKRRAESVLL